ncbi:DUF1264-domain-containing protein [Gautieria morchelliformis]|nr:DUF1264-domain-containing protein [Gautieria morchelliformis]
MNSQTKQALYGSLPYNVAGSAIMDFKPVNAVHQHLCAFHSYAVDQTRQVEAHHFCTHLTPDFHQCIIYDSDAPDAKLLGIEYIVSEKVFSTLPENERVYWHSHKYEVESGLLQLHVKSMVSGLVTDPAEKPAMLELQRTYGKTIHTWQIDTSPDLPLGPPSLMMSFTADGQVRQDLVHARDTRTGQDTLERRLLRQQYLHDYEKAGGSDQWVETGQSISFEPVIRPVKSD